MSPMTSGRGAASADELLDEAADAVARNEWVLARDLARAALQQARDHPEAELIVRTADAYVASASASADPLAGSRDLRFMSIMFCDVVGSSRLAAQLGDARWRDTLERFRRRCARAVRRYDGNIHEASGDEILVLFGYPRIREDDARRAVLAGLDAIAAVRALSTLLQSEYGCEFHVRIGVHTGRALIRDAHHESFANEHFVIGGSLFGRAANIAKAVESGAAPDSVWISEDTRRIVEGFFEFAREPGQQLEVGAQSIASYEVVRPTAALNRHQIARVRSDEMIGRSTECEQLLALWERAKREGAPIVLVSGPAGIGKSRLVEYLAESAAGGRASRLECVCVEMLTPIAFAPITGLIERFANIRQADDGETRLAKLEAALLQTSPEFERVIPFVAWMMSIPLPGHPGIDQLDPEAIRTRIFDSLLTALGLFVKHRPAVLWIEDVQWADHSTREFCRRLQLHGPIPGLLTVVTWRAAPDEARGRLPWWDQKASAAEVIRMSLGALSSEESRQLIAARAAEAPDAERIEAILESTGGNPLYIEEVVRSTVAGGGVPRNPVEPSRRAILIPDSLHPIFAQFVDGLGADRRVAQVASLLGRELPEPLTRTVVAAILGKSPEEVVQSLERLIEAEVIEPHLTALSHGYRFRHELIRESLVQSIGPDVRQNHARIADAIEQSFPDMATEQPAVLAFHRGRAEQFERAATYRLHAGMRLQAKAAHQEAIASFEEGLDALWRARAGARGIESGEAAMAKLELALRASRGVSVQTTRGYSDPVAGEDWARAYELSRQIAAQSDLVPALLGLWSFYFVKGVHARAMAVSEQMVDVARTLGDPQASLIGHVSLGYSTYWRGDLVDGRDSAERGLALVDQVASRPSHIHVPQDPALAGLNLLAPARWSVGDQLGGIRAAEECERSANVRGHNWAINVARAGLYVAWLHQIRRAPQQAFDAVERALAVALEHRIDWAVVNLLIHKGLAIAHAEPPGARLDEGAGLVRENLGYWSASGAETMVPYFLGQLAEAFGRASRHAEALDLVQEALALGERIGERCHDAELHRVRGQARLGLGHHAEGVSDLRRAIAIARAQRATSFEVRAIVALLSGVRDLGDRIEWIGGLQAAVRHLQSSDSGPDELAAAAILAQV